MSDITATPLSTPISVYDLFNLSTGLHLKCWTDIDGTLRMEHYAQYAKDNFIFARFSGRITDSDTGRDFYTYILRGDWGDDDMLTALSCAPERLHGVRDEIRSQFKLPKIAEKHALNALHWEEEAEVRNQKRMARLQKAPPMPPATSGLEISRDTTLDVFQGDAAITAPDAKFPILATRGVGPCVVVMFRNPANQRIAMAHLQENSDVSHLDVLLQALRDDGSQPIDAYLWGGRPEKSVPLIDAILNYLEEKEDSGIHLAGADVLKANDMRPESMIIMSHDGKFYIGKEQEFSSNTASRDIALQYHLPTKMPPREHLASVTVTYNAERQPLVVAAPEQQATGPIDLRSVQSRRVTPVRGKTS